MPKSLPRVLTIAGSDSGGGAGIQADLKTFSALGVYGMSALTAITAQNTRGVSAVHDIPPEIVAAQIDAVLEDIGAGAIKTGMLSSAPIIEAVASALARAGVQPGGPHAIPIVIDPVMVATSGDPLLRDDARDALVTRMLPLAFVVTPNIPEAEALSGVRIESEATLRTAAERIHALGPAHVLIKGGHLGGPEAIDWLYNGQGWRAYAAPRIDTRNTHGTGCTYAAAIAAGLAQGHSIENAVQRAKDYLTGALEHAAPLGHGHGPVNHLWQQEPGD